MAFDEGLAQRLREALAEQEGIEEKKMFGGLAFMLRGNLCCGVSGDDLMVRVGPDGYEAALANPHAREMDITGRPMRGWVLVAPEGLESEAALAEWVQQGVRFTASLPLK